MYLPLVRQTPGNAWAMQARACRSDPRGRMLPGITIMSQEQLTAILTKGDTTACVAYFAKLSEKERREYAESALAWFKPVFKERFIEVKPGIFHWSPLLEAI